MPARVHALNVGIVVLPLAPVTGCSSGIDPHCAADQQTSAGANGSPLAATNRRTSRCTDRCANHRTTGSSLIRHLLAAAATNLPQGKITAGMVVIAKALHRLPGTGQDHDIRSAGHDAARS